MTPKRTWLAPRTIGLTAAILASSVLAPAEGLALAPAGARVAERHVLLAEQKAGASLRPNRMAGEAACRGFTLDNYSRLFSAAKAKDGVGGDAAHCALAFSSYDAYLRAIAYDQPRAKIDEAYARHERDVRQAIDFLSDSRPVTAHDARGSTGASGIRIPALPSGPTAPKCAPRPAQQATSVEFSAKSQAEAVGKAPGLVNERVRALCGGRAPQAAPKYGCKVVNSLFGDFVCKVTYSCPETAPACTP
jgi:hypothetical protein